MAGAMLVAPFIPAPEPLTMDMLNQFAAGLESSEYGFIDAPRDRFVLPIIYLREKGTTNA